MMSSNSAQQFVDQPNPLLNGRAIPLATGKVLGGGSSINVMTWHVAIRTTGIFSHLCPGPAESEEELSTSVLIRSQSLR
jgi:hypothetical protein